MTRSVAMTSVLILALSPLVGATTGVRVEGEFVRTGTFTEVAEVEVGQPVQLIVRVRDISSAPLGVAGGLIDVTWDSDVLELLNQIDDTDATTNDVSPLFNQDTWTWRYTGAKTGDGSLRDMGAGQGIPPNLFLGDSEVFFTLDFMPVATGQADVTLIGHDFGVIVKGQPDAQVDQHVSVNPVLTVVEAQDALGPGAGAPVPPVGCLGTALAVGALMAAGCSRTLASRRQRRR